MPEFTKLFFHTGTTDPTDIGPARGAMLYSVYVDSSGGSGEVILRDGGPSGAIIFQGRHVELKWRGVKLDGQLNITLGKDGQRITVEMSEQPLVNQPIQQSQQSTKTPMKAKP